MSRNLHSLAVASIVAVGLAACSHDRPQDAKAAEAQLSSDEMRAHQTQTALDQKQADEQVKAQQSSMDVDKRAELEAKQRSERAEQRSDDQQMISSSQTNVMDKGAVLDQERRDFESKSKERITKLDAKAKELKAKSGKLTAQKKADFTTNWQKYVVQKGDADTKVGNLPRVTNDGWNSAKQSIETTLDSLDAAVDNLGKDL
ncbi:hypothetical protein AKJ09_04055 [Labilithrix luteola]|uniref:Lipoprotein n=1 Tax=Labilithrix luteola TaxID=1391654 RepID=A0A0K1PVJ3_9BACT|nr:hypothetical protein [Labilithrix luteola]AKU97391.1 hypothetical protein AKJ09_04055 [Labilithrix luteola]